MQTQLITMVKVLPVSKESMTDEQFSSAKKFIEGGGKIDAIERKYSMTELQKEELSA